VFVFKHATLLSTAAFSAVVRLEARTSSLRSYEKTVSLLSSPKLDQEEDTSSNLGFSPEVLAEANDALTSVGWAPPRDDGELTADDPFVREINAGIQRDVGVSLDELLNPAKVEKNKLIYIR